MRTHSVYEFECECGRTVQCEDKQTRCPHCGRLIRLIWREEKPSADPS